MKERKLFRILLGTGALAGLLLGIGVLLRPAGAAPAAQEDGPELFIAKVVEGDGTIAPGQTVRFTVAVTNTGAVSATNVVVLDDYDQAALPTIKILSEAGSGVGGAQNDGDVISWELGDLPPGESRRLTYDATAADAFEAGITEVVNVASVEADNAVGIAPVTVALAVRAPQLTLALERKCVGGEAEVCGSDTVRYTVRYGNNGTVAADNVVVEATFNETVVWDVGNISVGGERDGATLRWDLGTVAAGASDEVSYELTLMPALPQATAAQGTVEVRTQATIRADDVEPLSAVDSFTLDRPILGIERSRVDLNGDPIEPGDTLRFTIRFRNSGATAASDVLVRDDFDEAVVAGVSNISAGGQEADGAMEWVLTELGPGAEQTVSYNVRLIGAINESTEVANTAIIYVRGVDLTRYQTKMTIEPVSERPATTTAQVFEKEPVTVALLVGLSTVTALLMLGGLAVFVLTRGQWKDRYFRFVIEGVAVVVIVEAVLVLAMNKNIEPDGAVTILSGIAGYLLGRGLSESGGSG